MDKRFSPTPPCYQCRRDNQEHGENDHDFFPTITESLSEMIEAARADQREASHKPGPKAASPTAKRE